jgi:hypothetical protein
MTTKLTPWMSVATPPLKSRPGFYDVRFFCCSAQLIEPCEWNGCEWIGCRLIPHVKVGDQWRGVAKG